jgi:hypothetical protein
MDAFISGVALAIPVAVLASGLSAPLAGHTAAERPPTAGQGHRPVQPAPPSRGPERVDCLLPSTCAPRLVVATGHSRNNPPAPPVRIVIQRTLEQVRYLPQPAPTNTGSGKNCAQPAAENAHGLQVLPKLITINIC